jgi:hypothetical protein
MISFIKKYLFKLEVQAEEENRFEYFKLLLNLKVNQYFGFWGVTTALGHNVGREI